MPGYNMTCERFICRKCFCRAIEACITEILLCRKYAFKYKKESLVGIVQDLH